MDDKDIITALNCCANGDCKHCPSNFGHCYANLALEALDLILRQQKKIEELTDKHWSECRQIAHYSDKNS